MIYPTKSGTDGHEWYLPSNGQMYGQTSVNTGSDSQGTYYTFNDTQVRGSALTRFNYRESDCDWDASELDPSQGGDGHMQGTDPTWRDVEMTGYYYVTASGDDIVHYCRGGRHSSDVNRCIGVAYKAALDYDSGEVRVRKEQWHANGYVDQPWRSGISGGIRNKWVGFKAMFYNVPGGGSTGDNVKMEIWVDGSNNNNWTKVYDYTDTGSWGDGNHCSGRTNQKLVWSAPLATFRWDTSGVRFKKCSVREISPSGGTTPPPSPGPPGPPPPPPGPLPPPPGSDLGERLLYPIEGVSASSNGFPGAEPSSPGGIGDDNEATAWRPSTLPAWIKVDMATRMKIMYLRILWGAAPTVAVTISYDIELSHDNITYTRVFNGTVSVPVGSHVWAAPDFVDQNARFIKLNVLTNSVFDSCAIREVQVWGSETPIGEEPPTPPPPPGIPPPSGTPPSPPPPVDSNYVYQQSRHVFHVNFSSQTTGQIDFGDIDACAPNIPILGSGPTEDLGPDIFNTTPPPPPPVVLSRVAASKIIKYNILQTPPPAPPPPVETNPPLVISTTPSNGATGIEVGQSISIVMTEEMSLSSINSSTVIISPAISASYLLTGTTNETIVVDPISNLSYSTAYTVTVKGGSTGVKDLVGNPLPSNHIFSFTTKTAPDLTAPTIVSKTPDSGATGVASDTSIVITFSEPMNPSRVTDSEIDLWITAQGVGSMVPRIVTLSSDGLTATVTPVNPLGGGIQYTCRVRGGVAPSVADLAGNAMSDPDIQWNFTTAAPTYNLIMDLSSFSTSTFGIDHNPYKRRGLRLDSESTSGTPTNNAPLFGKRPKKVEVPLHRVGNPGGTTSVKIMRFTDSNDPLTEVATIGTMNSIDITTDTNGAWYSFVNDGLDHPMEQNDCIVVETSAGTTSNHIVHRRSDSSVWDKGVTIRGTDTDAAQDSQRDFILKVYE